jgi:dTDP-4-dehydrorhamnose reductase
MRATGNLAVVGAGGVLGAKVVEQALAHTDEPIFAFTHGATPQIAVATSPRITWQELDLADSAAMSRTLARAQPAIVINTAAMTNVDACELRRDEAFAANAAGPRYLAEACAHLGARFLHVSTDYVFAGDDTQPGPYFEDAAVQPVNYYGWSKLQGERAVQEVGAAGISWLVVRTALVYGHLPGGRTNFVMWLVGELRAGRRVKVVNDQINTPTVADDLARVLLDLAQSPSAGIIHVAGPDLLSRYAWAKIIASTYGLDEELIDATTTAELQQTAKRPLQSGLRSRRADEWNTTQLRGVREGLRALPLR